MRDINYVTVTTVVCICTVHVYMLQRRGEGHKWTIDWNEWDKNRERRIAHWYDYCEGFTTKNTAINLEIVARHD